MTPVNYYPHPPSPLKAKQKAFFVHNVDIEAQGTQCKVQIDNHSLLMNEHFQMFSEAIMAS